MAKLPNRLFFTGVPGSRWSGISQLLSKMQGVNNSDCTPDREYRHTSYSGHKGAYFGTGMEFDSFIFDRPDPAAYVDSAWKTQEGMKIVKSHEWAYVLHDIKDVFHEDWIMLVYRPDMASYTWWHEAGGFQISYPNYQAYENSTKMHAAICEQNNHILDFACSHDAQWSYLTKGWIKRNFGQEVEVDNVWKDVLVTVIK